MLGSATGWEKMPIAESGEKLVNLDEFKCPRLLVHPYYYNEGYAEALPTCYVRQQVAVNLCEASKYLPSNWKLVVLDGWRPINLQRALFEKLSRKLDVPIERKSIIKDFVSVPSENPHNPSPHLTGGAVDVSLVDDQNQFVPMGTDFDHFGINSATRSLEERISAISPSSLEMDWLRNRRILFHSMRSVGFTNYAHEWWHFDYGNQFWAIQENKMAIYGPIRTYLTT